LIQNLFGEILPRFMLAYPKVRLQLKVINRRADSLATRSTSLCVRDRAGMTTVA
jgi:DNA-binding transcriptional LysR family regulator